jgi:hypothetical protein
MSHFNPTNLTQTYKSLVGRQFVFGFGIVENFPDFRAAFLNYATEFDTQSTFAR